MEDHENYKVGVKLKICENMTLTKNQRDIF